MIHQGTDYSTLLGGIDKQRRPHPFQSGSTQINEEKVNRSVEKLYSGEINSGSCEEWHDFALTIGFQTRARALTSQFPTYKKQRNRSIFLSSSSKFQKSSQLRIIKRSQGRFVGRGLVVAEKMRSKQHNADGRIAICKYGTNHLAAYCS